MEKNGLKMSYKIKFKEKLIVQIRIMCKDQKHYWHVYLWEDREAYQANISPRGCSANACCIMFNTIFPKLGEIHFVKDSWNLQSVIHELGHAMLFRMKRVKHPKVCDILDLHKNDDEIICQELGAWAQAVYSELWSVNPLSNEWIKR